MELFQRLVAEARSDVANVPPAVLSRTPSVSAPKNGRVRRGAVNPTMTTSWRFEVLIFSQSSVRLPDR